MRIKFDLKFDKDAVCQLLANAFLVSLFSIVLSGQIFASDRIGVCNEATESKPIEVESDTSNRTIAYPNLSEAFYAINQGDHTGEIFVEICFDSVEREAAVLNSQETESAIFSKVTIRPLKDEVTISAKTGYNAFIALNGTDRVTIDGDNPNSAGVNRNLTLRAWGGRSVIAVQTRHYLVRNTVSKYDSASYNTLKNLNIDGNKAISSYGIALGGRNPSSSGHANYHNSIINCAFRRVRTGIFSGGKSPAKPNIGTIIRKNDLSSKGTDRVRLVGIHLEYESNAIITENRIGDLKSPPHETRDQIGIRLGGGRMSSLARGCKSRCYRSVSNSTVARNIISGVTGGDRQSVAGIYIYGYENALNVIRNNVITGVIGSALTPNVTAGIFVAGQNDARTLLYNNSISMTGEYGSDKIHNPSFGFVGWGEDIYILLFNNIFSNTQTAAQNPWAKSFAAGFVIQRSSSEKKRFGSIRSDNNIFYSSGNNVGFIRLGSLQRREGDDIENLSDWQKISENDAESLAEDPMFVNPADNLNLQENSPAIDRGTLFKSNTDANGFERPFENEKVLSSENEISWKLKSDIGAYEWKP